MTLAINSMYVFKELDTEISGLNLKLKSLLVSY